MRVCIAARDGSGSAAQVHDHFGSAPCFVIADTVSGELEILENDNSAHAHGTCQPLARFAGRGLEAVVVGGIGRRALALMRQEGLKVYRATGGTVGETVQALAAGNLAEMEDVHACGGHAHGKSGCH